MTTTTILYDLDGTLVDSRLDIAAAFQVCLADGRGWDAAQRRRHCPAHRQTAG